MKKPYSAIRGTVDFSPSESRLFLYIVKKSREVIEKFGYEEIILPVLEEKGLFKKSLGENTDIAQRQMFKIEDKDIVLRPEGTSQVVRYFLEKSLHKQHDFHKFSYIGPMFRGERPQKGRLRQFHHVGVEAMGSGSFYVDAEVISLCAAVLDNIGVKKSRLCINSLGCSRDKKKLSFFVKDKLQKQKSSLCPDCQKRLKGNPLRVIDCKKEQCKAVVKSLGLKEACLCDDCKRDFKNLLGFLDSMGLEYVYDPYLVRGLDYYTNTVFEVIFEGLGSQNAIGAGGRYNNLVKFLGGPDIPAVGFALGIERIMIALGESEKKEHIPVFVAYSAGTSSNSVYGILNDLRKAGIASDTDYCGKSLKAQMRNAQRRGADFVVIIGKEELEENKVLLKSMKGASQQKLDIDSLTHKLHSLLKEKKGD